MKDALSHASQVRFAWYPFGRHLAIAIACVMLAFSVAPKGAAATGYGVVQPNIGQPKVKLIAGGTSQPGILYRYLILHCGGSDCIGYSSGNTPPRFPSAALAATTGSRVKLIIKTRDRPRRIGLSYWSGLDAFGRPIGAATPLQREVSRLGKCRWRIRFAVPPLAPEAFVSLKANWQEPGLFERTGREFGVWGFRLGSYN